MQTSPPLVSELMAALIDVYCPTLSTPSPTVTVQQQPQSSSVLCLCSTAKVYGNPSPNWGNVTMDNRV